MQMFGYIVRDKIFLLGSQCPQSLQLITFVVRAVMCKSIAALFLLPIFNTGRIFHT